MDQQNSSFSVKLYIYDLSKGMARQLSPAMLGKLWWWEFWEQSSLIMLKLTILCNVVLLVRLQIAFLTLIIIVPLLNTAH